MCVDVLKSHVARILPALVFAAALNVFGTAVIAGEPQATASRTQDADIARDFESMMAFVDGAPLDAPERHDIAADTAAHLRGDPAATRAAAKQIHAMLATLAIAPAWQAAGNREALRYGLQFFPRDDAARQIAENHDPTVVFDAAHKRLVTEHSLAAWRTAAAWLAKRFGVPGPDAGFVETTRAAVREKFASLSSEDQEAVAHVERNFPFTRYAFEHADPAKLASAMKTDRAQAEDHAALAMNSARLMRNEYDDVMDRIIESSDILLQSAENFHMLYRMGYNNQNYVRASR